jgi:hypothetical protein
MVIVLRIMSWSMIFSEKWLRLFPIMRWLDPSKRPGAPGAGVEQLAAMESPSSILLEPLLGRLRPSILEPFEDKIR